MFLFKRHGIYHVEYFDKVENRKRRLSTGASRYREALSFLTEFKSRLETEPATRSVSIEQFANEYKTYLKDGHSRKYFESVEGTFRMLTAFLQGENRSIADRLQSLDAPLLERFFSGRFEESPSAAGLYYRTLKAALSKAKLWGYVADNPVQRLKLPKIPKHLPVFLSESELESICSKTEKDQFINLFRFGFLTGMRLSEILNLQWSAIDMTERVIKVSNTDTFTTKSKSERIIPINGRLFKILAGIQPKILSSGKNYLFSKQNGERYSVSYVSHEFKDAARKADVGKDIHFHSLRHSFASNLVKRGVPIVTVKELLGHSDISTTMIYSHVKREDLANAVKMLEGD